MTNAIEVQQRRPRVAVVGGGLAGLAAANRLCEGASGVRPEVTLFEAGDRLGGVIKTEHDAGFLIEHGPDMFLTKPAIVSLCERLGLADRLIATNSENRRSLVLRNGRPVPIPEGFSLLSPGNPWAILKTRLFSPLGKIRLGAEFFIPARRDDADESLKSFATRRLGRQVYERLIEPLVGGIYTADPAKLSLNATLPRFVEMERKSGGLIKAKLAERGNATQSSAAGTGARYGMFASFPNGVSELIGRLAEQVADRAIIKTSTPIQGIDHTEDGYIISTENAPAETFDGVLMAASAQTTAKLLRQIDEKTADLLDGIEYASSAVVVTCHRLEDINNPMDAFGLVIPSLEHRKPLAISYTSRKFPGRAPEGTILLRTFLGGAMHPEILKNSNEELLHITLHELDAIFGLRAEPLLSRVVRWDQAMPQYNLGHCERVDQIDLRLADFPTLAVAGNAYRGVGLPDVVENAEQAAMKILNAI
ncbi:protoporphyrinogen oxidase [Stratiformator vulcanicus]|uniref:Coproporphyrinogen III oxidase n=1 Tax=Stratiformator vulcanicus TaxID=2527980 RepID=A0A517R2H4_9PLAN|nr:protoporphyrinogen oxidase [Stratiformator vulcanicus]QDT38079.1 Protoporphyrinogen oxidase [Stratiformator vulcanicus]